MVVHNPPTVGAVVLDTPEKRVVLLQLQASTEPAGELLSQVLQLYTNIVGNTLEMLAAAAVPTPS